MTIEILFALVLMLGIASGMAQPSRLALIPTLVDCEVASLSAGYQFGYLQPRAVHRSGTGGHRDRGIRDCRCFRRERGQPYSLRKLLRSDAVSRLRCSSNRSQIREIRDYKAEKGEEFWSKMV